MLEAIIQGISNVFTLTSFPWIFLGVVTGLIVGILPGLGGPTMLAILIPVIYGKDPTLAISFLVALHSCVFTGGAITSILFGIPGEETTSVTIIDGYPMAEKGEAGRAMGAAFMSSMLGGIFGAAVLAALIPVVIVIVMAFGSPELFAMGVLAISFVATLGQRSMNKALIAALLGMIVGCVGMHPSTGQLRYTMGSLYLSEGIPLISVCLGLFALPVIFELMITGTTIAKVEPYKITMAHVTEGFKDVFRNWWLMIRCSAIGAIIGILPGIGAMSASFIAYGHAKQTSKHASEFGTGCVEGVIAPQAAIGTCPGGDLLPTLAFGIPGSSAMVLILAALMVVGITPGQRLMTEHLDLVWTLVITLVVANILASSICALAARDLAKITFLKNTILVPIVILFVIIGAYGTRTNVWDVVTAFAFGGIGYLMVLFGYSPVTFLLGYILVDYIERYFIISVAALGPAFLLVSPIATVLLVMTILSLMSPVLKGLLGRVKGRGVR